MLGKLLKHELKAQYSMYIGMYLFIVLLGGVYALGDLASGRFPGNPIFKIITQLSLLAVVIGLAAMFIVTLIMSILRYRNNLLRDEGYLMHTLPVTPFSLHVSKMIAALIWIVADMVVLVLMIAVLTGDWKFNWLQNGLDQLEQSGLEFSGGMIALLVIYMVFAFLLSISQFYVSLNLGYLSYGSKGLMSFVAYLVTYMIAQVVSVIGLMIFGFVKYGGSFNTFLEQTSSQTVAPTGFMTGILTTSAILSVLLFAAYNIVSVYILKKKLNLE